MEERRRQDEELVTPSVLAALLLTTATAAEQSRKRQLEEGISSKSAAKKSVLDLVSFSSSVSVPVPRLQMESILLNSMENRRVHAEDCFVKWIRFHEGVDGQFAHMSSHWETYISYIKIGSRFQKELSRAETLSKTATGSFDHIARDSILNFLNSVVLLKKSTMFPMLPLEDQVKIMGTAFGIHYSLLLALRSMDLDGALRLSSNLVVSFDDVSKTEHPALRDLFRHILVCIVEPLQHLNLDDFELYSLLTISFWEIVSSMRLISLEMTLKAKEILQKLTNGLGDHIYAKKQPGRFGQYFMVISRIMVLQDIFADQRFAKYKKLKLFQIPEDLMEHYILV